MNENTFYQDYSNHEYDGWCILKSTKGIYAIFETHEHKAGKARVKLESMDGDFESLYAAMHALRRKVKEASKNKNPINAELAPALKTLGISKAETREQVIKAFRDRVKAHADGQGGYVGDMDQLVQAKEYALQHVK